MQLIIGIFIGVIIMLPFLLQEQSKSARLEKELESIAKSVGGVIKKYGRTE